MMHPREVALAFLWIMETLRMNVKQSKQYIAEALQRGYLFIDNYKLLYYLTRRVIGAMTSMDTSICWPGHQGILGELPLGS